jgi:hypothetical protein
MTEYGDIFDYRLSMMAFEYVNFAFFATYGLAVVWIAAHPKSRIFDRLRNA